MIGYGAELQQCQRISFTAQMLQETRNKLFLMKSDMPYLDIDAREGYIVLEIGVLCDSPLN